jgi:hypothetical protein
MLDLNQIEVRNLKKLISISDVEYRKLSNYADYSVDPQIKQVFNKAAQDSLNCKTKLLSFLSK